MKRILCFLTIIIFMLSINSVFVSAKEYSEEDLYNMTDASDLLDDEDEDVEDDADDYNDGDSDDISDNSDETGITTGIIEITPNHIVYCIDQDDITTDMVKETYVVVNGKKYNGSYISSFSTMYETIDEGVIAEASYSGKINDLVTIHFIMKDGRDARESDRIDNGLDEVVIDEEECDIKHAIFYYLSDTDKLKTLDFKVNGKSVSYKNYTGKNLEDYEADNYEYAYVYQANYKTNYKAKVSVTVTTEKGYTYNYSTYAKDIKPNISVNNFYAGDTVISGKTKANSSVIIKAGGKKYKTTANSNGSFAQKIKALKAGKKITVTVTTTTNRSASKTISVNKSPGKVSIKSIITAKSRSVKISLTNVKEGDIVKLFIGSKTYKSRIKSAKKSTTVTINIKPPKKGLVVKAKYTDKFNTIKSTAKSKVN